MYMYVYGWGIPLNLCMLVWRYSISSIDVLLALGALGGRRDVCMTVCMYVCRIWASVPLGKILILNPDLRRFNSQHKYCNLIDDLNLNYQIVPFHSPLSIMVTFQHVLINNTFILVVILLARICMGGGGNPSTVPCVYTQTPPLPLKKRKLDPIQRNVWLYCDDILLQLHVIGFQGFKLNILRFSQNPWRSR